MALLITKKILGIVFIGLLLVGCTTVKPTGGLYKETTLESGKSKIIILRKGGSLISADIPTIKILGHGSYFLPSKSYIQADVDPGNYNINVYETAGLVWRFEPFDIDVTANKNETKYLELITWSVGLVSRAKLETVEKAYALDKLKMFERTLFSDSIQ